MVALGAVSSYRRLHARYAQVSVETPVSGTRMEHVSSVRRARMLPYNAVNQIDRGQLHKDKKTKREPTRNACCPCRKRKLTS